MPIADLLNHSCINVNYDFMNKQLHLEGMQNEEYFYSSDRFHTDFSGVYNEKASLNDEQIKNMKGLLNKDVYLKQNHILTSVEGLRENLEKHHVWQVPFLDKQYVEDSDTSEEEEYEDEDDYYNQEEEESKMRQKHGFEYIIL